jgi:hypothetical protein
MIDAFANGGDMYLAHFFGREWPELRAPNRFLALRIRRTIGFFFDLS